MDNAVDAIIMAFSVIVFVIALTMSMYVFSQMSSTSELMLYYSDKTNYYDNIEIYDNASMTTEEKLKKQTTRTVGTDTIIPTLYRYYKENFCVKICDVDGTLIQIFDVNLEGSVRKAAGITSSYNGEDKNKLNSLKNSKYNTRSEDIYLFEAPWIGNTDTDTKTRIDFYIDGTKGYINNTEVDYSKNTKFCYAIERNIKFTEAFVEYSFSGDTITSEDGTETITGNKQENSKIIITYTAQEKLNNKS